VPEKETWRIAMPTPPKGAKWTEPPKIVSRLNYRQDRIGFTDDGYRHIFVLPADGGTARQVTTATGTRLAAISPATASGCCSAPTVSLTPTAPSAGRTSTRQRQTGEISSSRAAPARTTADGVAGRKTIAYIHADSTDHSAWAESKLWMMNADGSNPRSITNLDRPISGVTWASDNSGVYFNVESEGSKNFYFASSAGQTRALTSGKHFMTVTA